eukprot:275862_1
MSLPAIVFSSKRPLPTQITIGYMLKSGAGMSPRLMRVDYHQLHGWQRPESHPVVSYDIVGLVPRTKQCLVRLGLCAVVGGSTIEERTADTLDWVGFGFNFRGIEFARDYPEKKQYKKQKVCLEKKTVQFNSIWIHYNIWICIF